MVVNLFEFDASKICVIVDKFKKKILFTYMRGVLHY